MKHVLIIDDEAELGELVAAVLEEAGFTTAHASDKQSAIQLLRKKQFDKILLDLRIGSSDGLDLVPKIDQLQDDAEVVIVSAHVHQKLRNDPRTKRIQYFINKPFSKAELLNAIQ